MLAKIGRTKKQQLTPIVTRRYVTIMSIDIRVAEARYAVEAGSARRGQKLRELRESKTLSQGDIEKRTGLLRCYISRVENGHTIPASKLLRKYRGRSKFRSTNCFTMGMSRPRYRIPLGKKRRPVPPLAIRPSKRRTCTNSQNI
jgi:hypothetical protein